MSTYITTFIPASEKQVSFLTDLLDSRECDADLRGALLEAIEMKTLTKQLASFSIDSLLQMPRAKKPAAGLSPLQAFLAEIPKSKYAVPTAELMLSDFEDSFNGDLVFLELKEFNGRRYVRRLTGAPGAFTRSKLTADQTKFLFEIIAKDPLKYARIFGEHYTCCGSCGAELTDARSRELQLGPECRKKFGL